MRRLLLPLALVPLALLLLGVGTTYQPAAPGVSYSYIGQGCFTQAATFGLAVGCRTLGTAPVADAPLGSGCTPVPPVTMPEGMWIECEMTAAGGARIRQCTSLTLGVTAPAGAYCAILAKP